MQETHTVLCEMATGGYSSSVSSASSGDNDTSDNSCSEASSDYTRYSSSSNDECMEKGDDGTAAAGCKTFPLVKRCDHKEVGIYILC